MSHRAETTTVRKRPNDEERAYSHLTLTNGLQVLLIQDSQAQKAAASLTVKVGHFQDPDGISGLAHFCEHMLFLGSAKYPEEEEYSGFMQKHGGSTNAYTSFEDTNYSFDVSNSFLADALDRLAQFFIAPLFTADAIFREMNAVDSEHKKNLLEDYWRISQLDKSTSNKGHPYSKFGTGDLTTLEKIPRENGLDILAELKKFYYRYYSASVMTLCVVGNHSIETMAEWIVTKFSPILPHAVTYPAATKQPYDGMNGRVFQVVPVKQMRKVSIHWAMPSVEAFWRTKPDRYLGHLFGHEGAGSLLSLMKTKGWVDELAAGTGFSVTDFSQFGIEMTLTEEGESHIVDVVSLAFQYVRLLQREKPQRWIFEETKRIAEIMYRFKDKEKPYNLCTKLSAQMPHYPPHLILEAPYLFYDFDADIISSFLSRMTVDNARVFVVLNAFEGNTTEVEPIYTTGYNSFAVPDDWRVRLETDAVDSALHLPQANPFIPENLELNADVVKAAAEATSAGGDGVSEDGYPRKIVGSDSLTLFYKPSVKFGGPKACVNLEIFSPLAYASPVNAVMTELFLELIRDDVNELVYDAEIAGLTYSYSRSVMGFEVKVDGFSDKMPLLLDRLIDSIKRVPVTKEKFLIYKDFISQDYSNFDHDQPVSHAHYYLQYLLSTPRWHIHEYRQALGAVTLQDLQAFVADFFRGCSVEALVLGNIAESHATALVRDIYSRLTTYPQQPRQLEQPQRAVQRPTKQASSIPNAQPSYVFFSDDISPENENSAITNYYQVQVPPHVYNRSFDASAIDWARYSHQVSALHRSFNNYAASSSSGAAAASVEAIILDDAVLGALTEMTAHLMNKPAFHQLRTTEQLGYGLAISVQSPAKDPSYIDGRIEAFLQTFRNGVLASMSDEEFESNRAAVLAKKVEKDKSLKQEGARYWAEVTGKSYRFNRSAVDVAVIANRSVISKDAIVRFFDHTLSGTSQSRRKMSIQFISARHKTDGSGSGSNAAVVTDIYSFKKSLLLFPKAAL